MEDFGDFEAQPVPEWAAQRTGNALDFEDLHLRVVMTRDAMALSPDAFNWWLSQELAELKKTAMRAYHDQHDD